MSQPLTAMDPQIELILLEVAIMYINDGRFSRPAEPHARKMALLENRLRDLQRLPTSYLPDTDPEPESEIPSKPDVRIPTETSQNSRSVDVRQVLQELDTLYGYLGCRRNNFTVHHDCYQVLTAVMDRVQAIIKHHEEIL